MMAWAASARPAKESYYALSHPGHRFLDYKFVKHPAVEKTRTPQRKDDDKDSIEKSVQELHRLLLFEPFENKKRFNMFNPLKMARKTRFVPTACGEQGRHAMEVLADYISSVRKNASSFKDLGRDTGFASCAVDCPCCNGRRSFHFPGDGCHSLAKSVKISDWADEILFPGAGDSSSVEHLDGPGNLNEVADFNQITGFRSTDGYKYISSDLLKSSSIDNHSATSASIERVRAKSNVLINEPSKKYNPAKKWQNHKSLNEFEYYNISSDKALITVTTEKLEVEDNFASTIGFDHVTNTEFEWTSPTEHHLEYENLSSTSVKAWLQKSIMTDKINTPITKFLSKTFEVTTHPKVEYYTKIPCVDDSLNESFNDKPILESVCKQNCPHTRRSTTPLWNLCSFKTCQFGRGFLYPTQAAESHDNIGSWNSMGFKTAPFDSVTSNSLTSNPVTSNPATSNPLKYDRPFPSSGELTEKRNLNKIASDIDRQASPVYWKQQYSMPPFPTPFGETPIPKPTIFMNGIPIPPSFKNAGNVPFNSVNFVLAVTTKKANTRKCESSSRSCAITSSKNIVENCSSCNVNNLKDKKKGTSFVENKGKNRSSIKEVTTTESQVEGRKCIVRDPLASKDFYTFTKGVGMNETSQITTEIGAAEKGAIQYCENEIDLEKDFSGASIGDTSTADVTFDLIKSEAAANTFNSTMIGKNCVPTEALDFVSTTETMAEGAHDRTHKKRKGKIKSLLSPIKGEERSNVRLPEPASTEGEVASWDVCERSEDASVPPENMSMVFFWSPSGGASLTLQSWGDAERGEQQEKMAATSKINRCQGGGGLIHNDKAKKNLVTRRKSVKQKSKSVKTLFQRSKIFPLEKIVLMAVGKAKN